MSKKHYTDQEIVTMTQVSIHCFCKKNIETFLNYLDEDFVWIGDYAPLYMRGRNLFLSSIQAELHEPQSVALSEEEYTLLTHERHLWVVYGRFIATTGMNNAKLETKIHMTMVWQQKKETPKLLLANATHVQELPITTNVVAQSTFFSKNLLKHLSAEKLMFRDLSGSIHYLFSEEILYIKSKDKLCTVFTENSSFTTRSALKEQERPEFLLIHRSYLVNPLYIQTICRYEVVLLNGIRLPIGKERYMTLKAQLTPSI